MTDLEKYLTSLKERKSKLIKKRLPVVDTDCNIEKLARCSHNARIKIKTDSLDVCIRSVELFMKEES
ncbi:coil containing protein [Vibrio phage 1.161.O._10N.261.48.C5]|nr:coil containing protein [Vibrio phage 1.161.O._10N.261.48.C5]